MAWLYFSCCILLSFFCDSLALFTPITVKWSGRTGFDSNRYGMALEESESRRACLPSRCVVRYLFRLFYFCGRWPPLLSRLLCRKASLSAWAWARMASRLETTAGAWGTPDWLSCSSLVLEGSPAIGPCGVSEECSCRPAEFRWAAKGFSRVLSGWSFSPLPFILIEKPLPSGLSALSLSGFPAWLPAGKEEAAASCAACRKWL